MKTKIYYTLGQDPMILDTVTGLNELHRKINAFIDSDTDTLLHPTITNNSPEPYSELLKSIKIQKTNGSILVSIKEDGELHIAGSKENLKTYCSAFAFDSTEDTNHHHPELAFRHDETEKKISSKSQWIIIEARNEI